VQELVSASFMSGLFFEHPFPKQIFLDRANTPCYSLTSRRFEENAEVKAEEINKAINRKINAEFAKQFCQRFNMIVLLV